MSIIDKLAYLAAIPAPDDVKVLTEQRTRWRWATVTQVGPLRVRLDGESQALDLTPDSLVAGLHVNDRVKVVLIERDMLVVGVATNDTGWVNIPVSSGFSAASANERPQVRAIGGKVYARGGWSSTGMAANGTFTVGTIPAEMLPADMNALWRWGTSSGSASASAIASYTSGAIQCRTGSTLSSYFIIPAGTFWFRS